SSSYSAMDVISAVVGSRRARKPKINTQYAILPRILLVSANRLGTINHTLLAISKLQQSGLKQIEVVLMDILPPRQATPDTQSTPGVLKERLGPINVFHVPRLGSRLERPNRSELLAKKFATHLDGILQP